MSEPRRRPRAARPGQFGDVATALEIELGADEREEIGALFGR